MPGKKKAHLKIKFYNLGTIRETELDLRPLTVIIGPNNSNKTYIAYSVYGLLQRMIRLGDRIGHTEFKYEKDRLALKVNTTFMRNLDNSCKEASREFASTLNIFFQDAGGKLFSETNFEVTVPTEEVHQSIERLHKKPFVSSFVSS